MKRVAKTLQVPLEEIQELQCSQVDILPTTSRGKLALPVNDAVL